MDARSVDAAALVAASDDTFDALLAQLPQTWAALPADEPGDEIALAYIRAAYGRGYVRALGAE